MLDAARIARSDARVHGPGAMIVHYEALVADPAAITAQIASWLAVEFSADGLEEYLQEERWGAARGVGVVNTSVGRYRAGLSRVEVELIERIAFDELRSWGYTLDFATEPYSPGVMRLRCARIADGLRSLKRYGTERGIVEGVSYKFRQFFVARRGGSR